MTDKDAEPFYKSVTGFYNPKPAREEPEKKETKPLPKQDPEQWKEQANNYFKGNGVPKRVVDIDGGEEVYNKKLVGFLIGFAILSIIAFIVIGGVFVYKYKPTNIDQPINNDVDVHNNDTNNFDNKFDNKFENQFELGANIVIENVEVNCDSGGCNGNASA